MDADEYREKLLSEGKSEKQADDMVRVSFGKGGDVIDMTPVDEGIDDSELLDENGKLAVQLINRALRSNKIDNVTMSAAVRAVQMSDDARKRGGDKTPEDDMLEWVAEVRRRELDEQSEKGV